MRGLDMTGVTGAGLLPWLADMSLQATLVLGASLLVAWLAGRMLSAAKRHVILAAGLFSVPLLMLASPWAPGWGRRASPGGAVAGAVRVWSAARVAGLAGHGPAAEAAAERGAGGPPAGSARRAGAGSALRLDRIGVGLWAAGVGACGLLVLVPALRLRRLRLAATPVRSGRCFEALDLLRAEFGIARSRRLELLVSGDEPMPMTWGWHRPVILLPAAAAGWDEARLRLVLRHELAHVARADSAVSLGAVLCAGLLWFHPLAWLCCRRLWRLREQACDDHVLRASGEDPVCYAGELVAAIRVLGPGRRPARFPALALAMGVGRRGAGVLGDRVRALLEENRERAGFGSRARRVALPCWLLAVAALAGLSACRERTVDGEAGPAGRVFMLSDEQWLRLTGGDERFRPPPRDPFAPASSKRPGAADLSADDLKAAALVIRSHLIEEGVEFRFRTAAEAAGAVALGDARTLVVAGDEPVLEQVADLLRGYADERQIRILAHVFRVPSDFDYRGLLEIVAGEEAGGGVTGIVDAETARSLLERVGATEGAEVIAHPAVVTGSGRSAMIEVAREFIYPTEYEPPELAAQEPGEPVPEGGVVQVIPASPTAFETRHVGLELGFKPTLHADGRMTLDLDLKQIGFGGFVNYGSPIRAAVNNPQTGATDSVMLTENRIEMPVFTRSTYESKVAVSPGDWVVIGGVGPAEDHGIEVVDFGPDGSGHRTPEAERKTMLFFVIEAAVVE